MKVHSRPPHRPWLHWLSLPLPSVLLTILPAPWRSAGASDTSGAKPFSSSNCHRCTASQQHHFDDPFWSMNAQRQPELFPLCSKVALKKPPSPSCFSPGSQGSTLSSQITSCPTPACVPRFAVPVLPSVLKTVLFSACMLSN